MSTQLMVVPGCPNERLAADLLSDAARSLGWAAESVETITIASLEEAKAWGFTGSPSFFVNGADVLSAAGAEPAMACRVYRSASGSLSGCPEVSELAAALRSAATQR